VFEGSPQTWIETTVKGAPRREEEKLFRDKNGEKSTGYRREQEVLWWSDRGRKGGPTMKSSPEGFEKMVENEEGKAST